ncbi:TolC family protein [Daejeonella oryzae]|uniref:TolC family protein n=1 Tax=Daejeonella oryzae TaxID=1122943 RepID=UPI00047B60EF|nr:TolC family protein [Daejeonella oryzae]
MQHIKKFILIIILLNSGLLYGQEILSLNEILLEIERNNPALRSFENRIKSQDAKVEGAGAWMAPMVGAGTFMTPYPGQKVMEAGDKGAFMISAEQDIPNPAKTKAKAGYLAAQSSITRSEQGVLANQLRAKAKELYYDLLIAHKLIAYQKENLAIMQTMRKLGEIRYQYNQGALNQVFKAEGRFYEADNMIVMTQSSVRSYKIALNSLMNRPASTDFAIDTLYKVEFNPLPQLDTAYLASKRSDILQMERSITAMSLNINQVKQDFKPDFRLRFDHMSSYSSMMPRQFTVMGMLSIPIAPWSSKMYKSEIKSMNFEQEAMRQQKQAMLNEMLGMTKMLENETHTMHHHLENYENKILPALSKNMKVSMLSYQENKADLNTVIDAWETVNMAQVNYLDQLKKFYKMIVDYEKNIER